MIERLEQVAGAVARRASDLLCAPIWVLDGRGNVIAFAASGASQAPPARGDEVPCDAVRVPVKLGGQDAEVAVGPSAADEVIAPRLARVIVELTITQLAVVDRLPNPHELKNKFIFDLLRGPVRDEADIVREGQILGMDLTRPRSVILIDAADFILSEAEEPLLRGADSLIRPSVLRARCVINSIVSFFHLPDDTICAYLGEGEVAVLKASSTQDLAAWTSGGSDERDPSWADLAALKRAGLALLARLRRDTKSAISIGIGRYHPGIQQLARSYQDARAALSLGRRFHGLNQVYCLDSLGIAAFVGISDEQTKIDLARRLLSPLDQELELLETLALFFEENCSATAAANRLSIHRNTLSYRLDKIASLTGMDPRRFDDAVQIRLALLLRVLPSQAGSLGNCPSIGGARPAIVGQTPEAFAPVHRSA